MDKELERRELAFERYADNIASKARRGRLAYDRLAICEVAAQVEYDSRGCFLHLISNRVKRPRNFPTPLSVTFVKNSRPDLELLEGKATVKHGFGGRAPHSAKLTLRHIRPLKRRAA